MSDDDTDKTEDPTQKKLAEARKKGQVPVSRELNNWLLLTGATILIATSAGSFMTSLVEYLRAFIEKGWQLPDDPHAIRPILSETFSHMLGLMLMPFVVLMAVAFLSPFLQVGPMFAPDAIMPDLSKLSPMQGWKRIFSRRALMEFLKGVVKLCIIAIVGVMLLKPYFSQGEHMIGLPMPALLDEIMGLFTRLMTGILVVLMLLAIVDVTYQRVSFTNRMRMSKQDIKDEYKQSEGDPHIKAKLRQLRAEKARKRMMQNVPKADVVITNPTHFAIALQYNPKEMVAPICLAKGIDEVALRIRGIAEDNKITVVQNPPLARVLYDTVELDQAVPAEHYKAVAEVISYVFKLKGRLK